MTNKLGVDDFIVKYGDQKLAKLVTQNPPYWKFIKVEPNNFSKTDNDLFYQSMVLMDRADRAEILDELKAIDRKFNKSTALLKIKSFFRRWQKNSPKLREQDNAILWYNLEEDIEEVSNRIIDRFSKIDDLFKNESSSNFLTISSAGLPKNLVSSKDMVAFAANHFSIRRVQKTEDGIKLGCFEHIPDKILDTILSRRENLDKIRSIRMVTNTPQVVNDKIISTKGYDTDSGIYYTGESITSADSCDHLERLLDSFPFESETDKINCLGLIISFFFIDQYRGGHPSIIIQGDKQNLGKTTLAEVLSIIFQELPPKFIALTHEEELNKIVSAVVQENNVVLIDNIKKHGRIIHEISSPLLEGMITAPTLSFRELGANRTFERPNNVLFILTLNAGSFSPDLSTRSMYISLSEKSFSKIDPNFEPKEYALKHRDEILGSIQYLIEQYFSKAGDRKASDFGFFKFRKWGNNMNSILKANNINGFLSNQDILSKKYDPVKDAIENYFFNLPIDNQILIYKTNKEILEHIPKEVFSIELNPKARAMKVSKVLEKMQTISIAGEDWKIEKVLDPSNGGASKKLKLSKILNTGTSEPL